MTDGSLHFGGERYETPKEMVVNVSARPRVPLLGQEPSVDCSKPFPVRIIADKEIKEKAKIHLTNECFDAIFGRFKKGQTTTVNRGALLSLYTEKKKQGHFRKRQSVTIIVDRKDPARGAGEFMNGKTETDGFTTTLRVSPDVQEVFGQYMTEANTVYITLKKKKISVFSGAGFGAPVEEINLGWKFAYISAAISIPLSLLSMLGEAYDVPHKMRHGIEWGIHWIASLLH